MAGFKTITEPTSEPIPIAECRQHLRVGDDLQSESDVDEAEDALILDKLGAAREFAEGVTGLYLAPRTVELALDRFPCTAWIPLQGSPVRLIDSIEYVDEDGVTQDLDTALYSFNDFVSPPRLDLAFEAEWPATRAVPNAVKVRYVAGYGTITDSPPDERPVPRDIRSAMLLTLAHLYENREDSAPIALERIPNGALVLLSLKRENMGV